MHIPVMPDEVLSYLDLKPGKIIVDCTVGSGGHAALILNKISPNGRLIGIDWDDEALEQAEENLAEYNGQFKLISENFANLDRILTELGIKKIDGCLADLGCSSLQLEDPQRGFSIKNDGPLDMRMTRRIEQSAFDIVNKLPEYELTSILRKYGEERFSRAIAKKIVRQRALGLIDTTWKLANLVIQAVPRGYRTRRIHAATKTFQALRITVNRELFNLERFLKLIPDYLKKGARVCVISFHSLEDRLVKQYFKELATKKIIKILTKKPNVPTAQELNDNPRARSAKLRAAEKI